MVAFLGLESTSSYGGAILEVVEDISAREMIPKEGLFIALEKAVLSLLKSEYGDSDSFTVNVNRANGEIAIQRKALVCMDDIASSDMDCITISLPEAQKICEGCKVGDVISYPVNFLNVNHKGFALMKKAIGVAINFSVLNEQYKKYSKMIYDMVRGNVKSIDRRGFTIEISRGVEALLSHEECIQGEVVRIGDNIGSVVIRVDQPRVDELKNRIVYLSRKSPEFLRALFCSHVREISDGDIAIRGVVRDAGFLSKVAVHSVNPGIDPVGACVGVKGNRITMIRSEINNEKIDIIRYTNSDTDFVVNAMNVPIKKVVINENSNSMEMVVEDEDLHKAIGRRGQNVRLASQLTGYKIKVLSKQDEHDRTKQESESAVRIFKEILGVSEMMCQLLISEGFLSIQDVAYAQSNEFLEMCSTQEAERIIETAAKYLISDLEREQDAIRDTKIHDELKEICIDILNVEQMQAMDQAGIHSLEQVAVLSSYELRDIIKGSVDIDELGGIIVSVREKLRWI